MLRLALALGVSAGAATAQQVSEAEGVILRGLDKISGQVYDIEMKSGQTAAFDALQITLNSCRYPVGNPSGDAFAALKVVDINKSETVFSGWMVASAPALSAMDHARYDLWVMRCTTS
ncbi:hypothetical protein ROLI_017690 [Roseobacter fucihabitans]|uniref:DUF2155 domain-containing protein n=1 Tax=Roseobacter fucihabitans TaxID=1537242 RepID=A0ABZ2BSJ9_9RHOB|nr:DUF2155 domain-containing protein [Roseobacter litoralis]MBC6964356.1 hypothetical protein [Roseobacter litoralis]